MSKGSKRAAQDMLARQRALRDEARAGFSKKIEHLREGLTPDALVSRVIDDITYKSRGVVGQAIEIAADNRGIVIGSLAALGVWAARKPVGRGLIALSNGLGRRIARRLSKSTPANREL